MFNDDDDVKDYDNVDVDVYVEDDE